MNTPLVVLISDEGYVVRLGGTAIEGRGIITNETPPRWNHYPAGITQDGILFVNELGTTPKGRVAIMRTDGNGFLDPDTWDFEKNYKELLDKMGVYC